MKRQIGTQTNQPLQHPPHTTALPLQLKLGRRATEYSVFIRSLPRAQTRRSPYVFDFVHLRVDTRRSPYGWRMPSFVCEFVHLKTETGRSRSVRNSPPKSWNAHVTCGATDRANRQAAEVGPPLSPPQCRLLTRIPPVDATPGKYVNRQDNIQRLISEHFPYVRSHLGDLRVPAFKRRNSHTYDGLPLISARCCSQSHSQHDLLPTPLTLDNGGLPGHIDEHAEAGVHCGQRLGFKTFPAPKLIRIGDSLLTTVDNLIKVNATVLQQSQEERRGPTRAVQALETFADTVTLMTTDTYTAVRPGVALQATDISPEELDKGQGFAFFLSGNDSTSLTEGNVTSFTAEDGGDIPQTADVSIALPPNISNMIQINNTSEVRLSYTLYNSSSLFVQPSQGAARPSQGSVGTRIIGGRILGRPVKNLPEPVIITFTPLQSFLSEDVKGVTCVFWDFEAEAGQGDWSTEGCENIPSETKGRYTCACNHLTNFALLFDVSGKRFGVHEKPLEVITKVGCAVSIVCLVLTLLSFIATRRDKRRTRTGRAKNQRLVLINLCVALLAILVIFLVGINRTASPIGCMVVATLLHYFLLASLMWMAVEAVNLYRAVVQVFDSVSGHFIIKAGAVAWAGLILLFNLLVFILVMRKLVLKEKRQHELRGADAIKVDRRWIIHQIRRACSIMALFGLTWVFGFFVIDDARTVFAYLFCIFNTLQGLFIFIFHCVMREDMKEWRKKLTCWKKLACIGRKKQDVFQVDQNMSLSASAQSPQNIGLSPLSFDRKPKHEAVMTISMGSLDH
ncbi:hypothetical protein Bbelb_284200 [Branchiostoma belcheri]|nr:hypothetical protein Bbelb_284200 [Branchiostoma belcheri]